MLNNDENDMDLLSSAAKPMARSESKKKKTKLRLLEPASSKNKTTQPVKVMMGDDVKPRDAARHDVSGCENKNETLGLTTTPPDGQTIELLDEQEECQTKATDVLPEEKTHRDASAGEYIDESEEEVVDPEVNPIDGSNDNEPLLDAERQRCY